MPQEYEAATVGPASQVLGLTAIEEPATEPTQEQSTAQETPTTQQQVVDPQVVQQAAQTVESVDLNALDQALKDVQVPQQQKAVTPEEPATGEADKNFEAFNAQFKEVMGVDLKTGLQQYQDVVAVAQNTVSAMREQQGHMALREAKVELAGMWMGDVEVQQQLQQGTPVMQIVEDRMQYCARVYKSLPAADKQKVDAAGTAGVVALWNSSKQRPQSQQLPTSSVNAQAPNGKQLTREQILALPEKDFNDYGAALLDSGNYIKQQGVNSNGSLQRTVF